MDPVMKIYMFHQWLEDVNEQVELFKHHGYLIGSFTNPEAVQKLMGNSTISSTDEEFDQTWEMVAANMKKEAPITASSRRRRRKSRVVNG